MRLHVLHVRAIRRPSCSSARKRDIASPADPCQYTPPTLTPIGAAIGFPTPRRPPLGHVGRSPSLWVTPSRVSFGASPFCRAGGPPCGAAPCSRTGRQPP